MTKLLMTLTISVVASILVIGALIALPDAYSDKKNDNVPDECKCEKPDTLKVHLTVPDGEQNTDYRVDIFKKLNDRGNIEKRLFQTLAFVGDEDLMISASSFSKDKLESNTAFVVYEIDGADDLSEGAEPDARVDKEVALMEIHTSCSKPLFIGMTVFDVNDPGNGYSLEVLDGLKETERSIPEFEPNSCEDEKKKSTGSITIKKALTNDSGGTAIFADFTITVTNESNEPFDLIQIEESSIFSIDVQAGTYTLNETLLDPDNSKGTYTTVLIAGDTGCPSMLDEPFNIKKNKNLSCTIYNDDDGDGSTGGPGGIVFTNESLQIKSGDPTMHDSCDNPDVDYFDNAGIQILPCIQIINSESEIAIVDPELKNNLRTIILFSVFESALDASGAAIDPQCILERILPHNDQSNNLPTGSKATTNLAVKLACADLSDVTLINVNYVMIDPTNMS